MLVLKSISEWKTLRQQDKLANKKIGFVPTMGNLHAGHASLIARSTQENQITVLSIFVNPTQFEDKNDFEKYPKTLPNDLELAEKNQVDLVLIPDFHQLYPDSYQYQVQETEFSRELCGKHRPSHFNGVLTVVLKLLNLVKPHAAYFGEKDFQQLQLIRAMVKAFFLDIEIINCSTIRDENGLALSSRNQRLTPDQYRLALNFPKLLNSSDDCKKVSKKLVELGFAVDYIEDHQDRRFGAVRVGDVRLIDNIQKG